MLTPVATPLRWSTAEGHTSSPSARIRTVTIKLFDIDWRPGESRSPERSRARRLTQVTALRPCEYRACVMVKLVVWTARRRLIGLIVAASLLVGVPACSDDVAADMEAARVLAERGDAAAQAFLGEAYYFGNGVDAGLPRKRSAGPGWRLGQGNALGQALVGRSVLLRERRGAGLRRGSALGAARRRAGQSHRAGPPRDGVLRRERRGAGLPGGGPLGPARCRPGSTPADKPSSDTHITTGSAWSRTTGWRFDGRGSPPSRTIPSGRHSSDSPTTSGSALHRTMGRGPAGTGSRPTRDTPSGRLCSRRLTSTGRVWRRTWERGSAGPGSPPSRETSSGRRSWERHTSSDPA